MYIGTYITYQKTWYFFFHCGYIDMRFQIRILIVLIIFTYERFYFFAVMFIKASG
jgi:hypothetical protein